MERGPKLPALSRTAPAARSSTRPRKSRPWFLATLYVTVCSHALAADPLLSIGCAVESLCPGLAARPSGHLYVAGTTWDGTSTGQRDLFVGRYDPELAAPSFTFYREFGGSNDDTFHDLAVDEAGNVYLAGTTESRDFPIVNGVAGDGSNAFLVKLDPSGRTVFSTCLPGTDAGYVVVVDRQGNAYVGGHERGRAFAAKVKADGSGLEWIARPETTDGMAPVHGIAVGLAGDVAALVRDLSGGAWLVSIEASGVVSRVRQLDFYARRIAHDATGALWVVGSASDFRLPITDSAPVRDPNGAAYFRDGMRGTLLVSRVHALVASPANSLDLICRNEPRRPPQPG